jgi:hypothetical protein
MTEKAMKRRMRRANATATVLVAIIQEMMDGERILRRIESQAGYLSDTVPEASQDLWDACSVARAQLVDIERSERG